MSLNEQEYNLDPSLETFGATQKIMANLIKVGKNLLKQPVKTLNVTTFIPEEKPCEGTNAEAIERLVPHSYIFESS